MTKADLDKFISDAKSDAQLAARSMPSGTPANGTLQNVSALVTIGTPGACIRASTSATRRPACRRIKQEQNTDTFSAQVATAFTQWGITGGPVTLSDIPVPNGRFG